jgi:O-antigen/teichoic acid export membrane protein
LAAALWLLLRQHHDPDWPTLVCLAILSLYFWALYAPTTAICWGLVAGSIAGRLHLVWADRYCRRPRWLLRPSAPRTRACSTLDDALPLELGS